MKNQFMHFFLISSVALTACATFGKSEQTYLQSAKNNLAINNSQAALESANQAIKKNPQNYYAYYLAAQASQNLNQNNIAMQNYQQAMRLNKNESQLLVSYANFLCAQQDYGKAEALYNSAYRLSKESGTTATNLFISYGDCLLSQNKLDLAIDSYGKALANENAPISAYVGVTYAYLLEKNYASANYYASLYKQPANKDLLNLKIMALNGLLKSNTTLSNRQELQNQLNDLIRQKTILDENPNLAQNKTSSMTSAINQEAALAASEPQQFAETTTSTIANNTTDSKVSAASTSQATSNTGTNNGWIKQDANGRNYIIVSQGDTLYNISKRANLSVQQIITLNKLKSKNVSLGSKIYLN